MTQPVPYSYPRNFDKNRAIGLASLIDAAYQQLARNEGLNREPKRWRQTCVPNEKDFRGCRPIISHAIIAAGTSCEICGSRHNLWFSARR